jgi:hypothetical protein
VPSSSAVALGVAEGTEPVLFRRLRPFDLNCLFSRRVPLVVYDSTIGAWILGEKRESENVHSLSLYRLGNVFGLDRQVQTPESRSEIWKHFFFRSSSFSSRIFQIVHASNSVFVHFCTFTCRYKIRARWKLRLSEWDGCVNSQSYVDLAWSVWYAAVVL